MTDDARVLVHLADTLTYHAVLSALPEGDVLVHAADCLESGTLG